MAHLLGRDEGNQLDNNIGSPVIEKSLTYGQVTILQGFDLCSRRYLQRITTGHDHRLTISQQRNHIAVRQRRTLRCNQKLLIQRRGQHQDAPDTAIVILDVS